MRPIFPLPSSKIRCIVFSGAVTEHRAPRAGGQLLELDTTEALEKVGAGPTERLPGRRLGALAPEQVAVFGPSPPHPGSRAPRWDGPISRRADLESREGSR